MPDSLGATVVGATASPVVAAVASNVGTTIASGDGVVMGLAALLNVVGQKLKQYHWFRQNAWMIPTLLALGLALALFLVEDWRQAVLKAGMATWQAILNYGALGPKGIGIFERGTE